MSKEELIDELVALEQSEEHLKAQVADLRDKDERLESQAGDLVGLAEEAAVIKDELAKLNAQKDRFFAIIAHDLKSPFNALLGFSQILSTQAETLSREQVAEYGSLVYRSADEAFNLLDDLLEWSRLQLDRLEFSPETIDVSALLEKNLARFEPVGQAKNISIKIEATDTSMAVVDSRMIDTVIRNLISNGIKFTPSGGEIRLQASTTGNMVEVLVSDTGVGMAPETANSLFDIGVKSSTKGTDGEGGTGLGLQLSRELIQKHAGEISVTSVVGEGSTFRIALPTE